MADGPTPEPIAPVTPPAEGAGLPSSPVAPEASVADPIAQSTAETTTDSALNPTSVAEDTVDTVSPAESTPEGIVKGYGIPGATAEEAEPASGTPTITEGTNPATTTTESEVKADEAPADPIVATTEEHAPDAGLNSAPADGSEAIDQAAGGMGTGVVAQEEPAAPQTTVTDSTSSPDGGLVQAGGEGGTDQFHEAGANHAEGEDHPAEAVAGDTSQNGAGGESAADASSAALEPTPSVVTPDAVVAPSPVAAEAPAVTPDPITTPEPAVESTLGTSTGVPVVGGTGSQASDSLVAENGEPVVAGSPVEPKQAPEAVSGQAQVSRIVKSVPQPQEEDGRSILDRLLRRGNKGVNNASGTNQAGVIPTSDTLTDSQSTS